MIRIGRCIRPCRVASSLALAFVILASPAVAESAREILDRCKALEDGERHWTDRHQHMRMRIISSGGGQRERELDVYERRYAGNEEKAIVFLRGPAEVRDVAFLATGMRGRPAEQWLYLPSSKRVRRITVSTRNESFVGSDLSYHDLDLLAEMLSWSEHDATSTLRGGEPIGDAPCHAIELRPQREDIGYPRIALWLGRDDCVPRQVELHAQAPTSGWLGSLVGGGATDAQPAKRVRQSAVTPLGRIPIARRIDVETPSKQSRTEIEIVAVELDQGLPEDMFTQRALERGGK
jgi:hypothetical protein